MCSCMLCSVLTVAHGFVSASMTMENILLVVQSLEKILKRTGTLTVP